MASVREGGGGGVMYLAVAAKALVGRVLQCVAMRRCVAVHCSALQCVAVCCSVSCVLQCVAVCCIVVLQSYVVVVCCSRVLQSRVAVACVCVCVLQ